MVTLCRNIDCQPSGQEERGKVKGSVCQLLFSLQLTIPSIQYTEQCRLVRSGNKHFDNHCLPSTIPGEMGKLINLFRRDTFLLYLKCQKVCQYYGLPLTEDILIKGEGLRGWPQKDASDVHLRFAPPQLTCTQSSCCNLWRGHCCYTEF